MGKSAEKAKAGAEAKAPAASAAKSQPPAPAAVVATMPPPTSVPATKASTPAAPAVPAPRTSLLPSTAAEIQKELARNASELESAASRQCALVTRQKSLLEALARTA